MEKQFVRTFLFEKDFLSKCKFNNLDEINAPILNDISNGHLYKFGGLLTDGDNPFYNIITLDIIPDFLDIDKNQTIILGANFRCFDLACYSMSYIHKNNEIPTFYDNSFACKPNTKCYINSLPESVGEEILEIPKTCVKISELFVHDEDSQYTFNQIGGTPAWVQGEDIPNCPITQKPMKFLLQVDFMTMPSTGEYNFYSEGVIYFFWSDEAKISTIVYQQT
jgi:hypothetical protein